MLRRPLLLACTAMLMSSTLAAQSAKPAETAQPETPAPPTLPIAARYAAGDRYLADSMEKLIAERDPHATFVAGGRGVLFRRGAHAAGTIFFYDIAAGTTRPVVAEQQLATALAAAAHEKVSPDKLPIERVDYDPQAGTLSFGAFDKRWTLAADGSLAEAAKGAPDGSDAVSPDGRFRIVARDYNLFAVDQRSGREVALTTDGTREQPYGRGIPQLADILKAGTEEPEMPVSVRWSPDSRRIVSWRLDTRGVERLSVTQENPPGSFYPRSFRYVYPLAGAPKLPQAERLVIDVEQALRRRRATIVPVQVPSESLLYPADPDMGWEGDKVRVQWTERGYGQLRVYSVDPATGAATVVARESVKPIVTVTSTQLWPVPDLGGTLAVSERSGWAQLYLVRADDPDGGIPLTRGNWEVLGLERVDAKGREVLIAGVGREADRNPYYRGLYRVRLDGSAPQLLTPEPLDHDTSVSEDGRWFLDRMSSPTVPTRTVLRDASDGRIVLELGKADPSALMATGFTPPEPFTGLAADGKTVLHGMIFRPANFDPTKRYPIIDNVYTGPTTTQVPTSWDGAVMSSTNALAQIGAVVVMVDGRGTSRRGQAFRLPAYQNLGEVGIDDHIAMIRQMAARYPYLDAGRVGVYGGSAGGYDAARFILRRPGFFKVAVSSSGNHDLRLDKAWWPEVSMGYADPAVWERNSNLSVAGNLVGKLLLIHGDIDDNVPVTESFRLANALIQANRDVDIVILPNTTHRVFQPFFWRKLRDYFTRNLLDEAPPPLAPIVPESATAAAPTTAAAAAR